MLINLVNCRFFVTSSYNFQKIFITFAATREKIGNF